MAPRCSELAVTRDRSIRGLVLATGLALLLAPTALATADLGALRDAVLCDGGACSLIRGADGRIEIASEGLLEVVAPIEVEGSLSLRGDVLRVNELTKFVPSLDREAWASRFGEIRLRSSGSTFFGLDSTLTTGPRPVPLDPWGEPLTQASLFFEPGSLSVVVTGPEPVTGMLFILGLAALARTRRR